MDPVSAVGVAAGSIQFADFGVKVLSNTLRLLRNLRDAPKRINTLLQDSEESVVSLLQLDNRLQDAADPLVLALSSSQLQALRTTVSAGCQATGDLNTTLQRVKALPTDSKIQRSWKRVLSNDVSTDIENHLERIQRQYTQMQQQLHLAGLEVIVPQSQRIRQIEHLVTTTRNDLEQTSHELTTLETSLRTHMAKATTATHLSIEELKNHNTSMAGEISTQQRATQQLIETGGMHLGMKMDQLSGNVNSLRQQLLDVMVNPRTDDVSFSRVQQQVSQLTSDEHPRLNHALREALLRDPTALKQTCDATAARLSIDRPIRASVGVWGICDCFGNEKTQWSIVKGFFGLQYTSSAPHKRSCLLYGDRSWRYSFSLRIIPFLRKTIEVAFSGIFQGGGFAMAPSLTTWTTVRRSESALFRLFDDFPNEWMERDYDHRQYGTFGNSSGDGHVSMRFEGASQWYKYEVCTVEQGLEVIRQRLLSEATNGHQPWWIRDEHGATLAYEVVYLIRTLIDRTKVFEINFKPLLELAALGFRDHFSEPVGLEKKFVSNFSPRPDQNRLMDLIEGNIAFAPQSFENSVITPSLISLGLDFEYTYDTRDSSPVRRYAVLRLFQQYHELIPSNTFDGLLWAIMQRDLKAVERMVKRGENEVLFGSFPSKSETFFPYALHPLECALGWPEGIRCLMRAGMGAHHALDLVIHCRNVESLRIILTLQPSLLDLTKMICHQTHGANWFVKASWSLDQEIHRCVAQKLQEHLTNSGNTASPNIYGYFAVHKFGMDAGALVNIGFLDELYNAGLTGIDSTSIFTWRPLEFLANEVADGTSKISVSHTCNLTEWFLERGAHPFFNFFHLRPSIFHWLAFRTRLLDCESSQLKRIAQLISGATSILDEPDFCKCLCSTAGCLPLRWLLRCDKWPGSREIHQSCVKPTLEDLDNLLLTFLDLVNATEDEVSHYQEEAVRLEVFERLGLTHTCCRASNAANDWRQFPSQETHEMIGNKQAKFLSLLDTILSYFTSFRSRERCSSKQLLPRWWNILEPVLPERAQQSRCSLHLDNSWYQGPVDVDTDEDKSSSEDEFEGGSEDDEDESQYDEYAAEYEEDSEDDVSEYEDAGENYASEDEYRSSEEDSNHHSSGGTHGEGEDLEGDEGFHDDYGAESGDEDDAWETVSEEENDTSAEDKDLAGIEDKIKVYFMEILDSN